MQHTRVYKGGRQAEIYVSYPKKLQQFGKVICNYNNVQQNAATSQPKQSYLFSKKLTWTYFTLVARERDAHSISDLPHLHAPCFAHLHATLRKACVSDLLFPLLFSILSLFFSLGIQISRLAWQRISPLITQLSTIWHLHQSPSQSSE